MVAFIYRAEYYGLTEHPDGIDTAGLGELILGQAPARCLGHGEDAFHPALGEICQLRQFRKPSL